MVLGHYSELYCLCDNLDLTLKKQNDGVYRHFYIILHCIGMRFSK